MDMGNIDMPIMTSMLVIGRMISKVVMEFIPSPITPGMKANLKMEPSMGKVRSFPKPRVMIRL